MTYKALFFGPALLLVCPYTTMSLLPIHSALASLHLLKYITNSPAQGLCTVYCFFFFNSTWNICLLLE